MVRDPFGSLGSSFTSVNWSMAPPFQERWVPFHEWSRSADSQYSGLWKRVIGAALGSV